MVSLWLNYLMCVKQRIKLENILCDPFQLVPWSWRVLSFLWWREKLWLCDAETRGPPTAEQIFIKMTSLLTPALQENWPSTVFPSLMKGCTSAASLGLENQQRAGWLSEVRQNSDTINDLPVICDLGGYRISIKWWSWLKDPSIQPRLVQRQNKGCGRRAFDCYLLIWLHSVS